MKSAITFFLAILTVSAFAASNDSTNYSVVKHSQATFTTLDDTTGLAIMPEGAAFISGESVLGLVKTESGVITVIGQPTEDGKIKGISISADGNTVFINASVVVIVRKTFASHAEANDALISGEEYYLAGDRLTYHKP